MVRQVWHGLILAAGRGPSDPMAKAFGVAHKCLLPIAARPMLTRVLDAMSATAISRPFFLSIEDSASTASAFPHGAESVQRVTPQNSAQASVIAAAPIINSFPILVTTGDHPLLTPEMLDYVMSQAEQGGADILVGLAKGETIRAAYPETHRTYFKLGGTDVSGCNLFAIMNAKGLKLVEAWQDLEKNRKKPWKLIAAFGLRPLFEFAIGRLTPERAFELVSKRLGIQVRPVFMPFAEAAIDVDKPEDHALAERILLARLAGNKP